MALGMTALTVHLFEPPVKVSHALASEECVM
jgi:hypothetical protein